MPNPVVSKIRIFRRGVIGLLSLGLVFIVVSATYDSYYSINALAVNETSQDWHFGFNALVKEGARDTLLFGRDAPYLVHSGEHFPLRVESGQQVMGAYLAYEAMRIEIECPAGFSYYRVEIRNDQSRCLGISGSLPRLLSNVRFVPYIIRSYFIRAKRSFAVSFLRRSTSLFTQERKLQS